MLWLKKKDVWSTATRKKMIEQNVCGRSATADRYSAFLQPFCRLLLRVDETVLSNTHLNSQQPVCQIGFYYGWLPQQYASSVRKYRNDTRILTTPNFLLQIINDIILCILYTIRMQTSRCISGEDKIALMKLSRRKILRKGAAASTISKTVNVLLRDSCQSLELRNIKIFVLYNKL